MMHKGSDHGMHDMGHMHYVHLLIMTVLSFIAMYILMYAIVDRFANVYSSLNEVLHGGSDDEISASW